MESLAQSVGNHRLGVFIAAASTALVLVATPAQAKPGPFKGYTASISFAGSKAEATERITRGACDGAERTLHQVSKLSGSLKLGAIGSGLFVKPSGSLTEIVTVSDSAAGCKSENNVDTPIAATCTIVVTSMLSPSNASGYLGVGFTKSGGSFIIKTLTPQFADKTGTECTPRDRSATTVGPLLSGFAASLQGRVSANTLSKQRDFTTTLLPITSTEAAYDKYICGDPDAETSCQASYAVKATVTLKHHR